MGAMLFRYATKSIAPKGRSYKSGRRRKRREMDRRDSRRALAAQHAFLQRQSPTITAERTVAADHAVARHQYRDPVVRAGAGDRARRTRMRRAAPRSRHSCGSRPAESSSAHPTPASGTRCRAGRPAPRIQSGAGSARACRPAHRRPRARAGRGTRRGRRRRARRAQRETPISGGLRAPHRRRRARPCRCRARVVATSARPSAVSIRLQRIASPLPPAR